MDLTSRALARMIEGKTPEEIRATFKLPDDLTEEEKLEPLKSGLADARIKLLNKLYAKKRQVCCSLHTLFEKHCDSSLGSPCDWHASFHALAGRGFCRQTGTGESECIIDLLLCRAWR